ncbi:hypothetical protein ASF88_11250 [Leifsonia sp. Leaf336]|uniref:type IV toxin-antitoxin system AbiEi family antitoxin domain-containing protein n=1 Tax=Leifsonia sp. Leaf336 TaxID=1736341 RepID=UPI0006F62055|nr:type IV toxin-antitoxin system AbiEi family antitoxin domain-containing protein [Leifsonia sp. Leaf336]KQR52143.1 hypothetical protein ASF88_11250 [Leifsonia sp. Leaf336]
MNLYEALRAGGGAATRRQLRRGGIGDRMLMTAIDAGRIVRPRRGMYALPGMSREAYAALEAGGRLTCLSAARSYGLWGGQDGRLHLQVAAHAGRTDAASVRHWKEREEHAELWRVSIGDCLRSVVDCADEETAIAVLDTALSARMVTMAGLARIFACRSARARSVVARARPGSDSGVESILRQRLTARGHVVEQQVTVPGVGRVDARVDGQLYVEVDGFAFHSDRAAFERDRTRDTGLALVGARRLRFPARDVLLDPDAVVATIEAVLATEEKLLRDASGAG